MYLFGFGSLINLQSAQKSFKRELSQEDLIPVKITGYKKVWNSIENIDFEDIKNVNGIFLNLKEDKTSSVCGVLIKIDEKELEMVKLREKNYSCININPKQVKNMDIKEEIIAFMTTKKDKVAQKGDKNCFIASKYIKLVKDALKSYDEQYQKEFIEETFVDFPFELKDGTYSFSDPVQNKIAREGLK